MTAPLLTLRAIARDLGLPESTVRYYRDVFAPYLPTEGRGRRRRYPPDAVPLFRLIADRFAENRTREEIEAELATVLDGSAPAVASSTPVMASGWTGHQEPVREMFAMVLDGERERRDVMWQMAREIVRLGEALERQHLLLSDLVQRIERPPDRVLPAASVAADSVTTGHASRDQARDRLREELQRERELVDRLRRSKLEIERRAAEAEAALAEAEARLPQGLFRRRRDQSP